MNTRPFSPGFRISSLDRVVLLLGAAASFLAAQVDAWLGLVVAFTVGHFFLFCNVFRMPRSLELVWAAVFVLLIGGTITFQVPEWPISFTASFVCTVLVVAVQMRRPSYHGVAWKRINPQLPAWWKDQGTNSIEKET